MFSLTLLALVSASLEEDYKNAKITNKAESIQNPIFAAKVSEDKNGVLIGYLMDKSEGAITYSKVVLSEAGHILEYKTEVSGETGGYRTGNWELLSNNFLVAPKTEEAEGDMQFWQQRLDHEAVADGENIKIPGLNRVIGCTGAGACGTTVVRRLQGRRFGFFQQQDKANQKDVLEVYRIKRNKGDKLVVTQLRRDPEGSRMAGWKAKEIVNSYDQVLKTVTFENENAVFQSSAASTRRGNKTQVFQYCYNGFCQLHQTNEKEVKLFEKNGSQSKTVRKAGKGFFTWVKESGMKAEVGDFDTLLKECEKGEIKPSWSERVQITGCGSITKVVTKKGGKEYTFLSKLDGDKLIEATNASSSVGTINPEITEAISEPVLESQAAAVTSDGAITLEAGYESQATSSIVFLAFSALL